MTPHYPTGILPTFFSPTPYPSTILEVTFSSCGVYFSKQVGMELLRKEFN
jgi:hypothetical protein